MLQMLKREFYINRIYFLLILLVFPIITGISSKLLSTMFVLGFSVFNSFYYDNKNQTNRFIISMPIKKRDVVLARYLFFIVMINITLLYLWLVDLFSHSVLSSLASPPFTRLTIFFLFIVIGLGLSISIPLFYLIQSFTIAVATQFILIIIGIISFTIFVSNPNLYESTFIKVSLYIIEIQPIVIPAIFSMICLYISYRLSSWIFIRKDNI